MDFGALLHAAQRNEHKAKKEPKKCYNTTFSAPKKEQKSNKTLSDNIQKFLARREEEEKKKEQEAKKKRDELLALRSQDGKAKKRVAAMLNRTKAANKSAIQDAVDDDNTAVTLDGPSQPDEDDYGYVSQEASAYYNKLMDKYNSAPVEEPLFSQKRKAVHKDLSSTKDRVRMALLKQEEEEMMPHKRKRRSKTKKDDDPGDTTLDYRSSDLTDLGPCKEEDMYSDEELERQPVASKPKFKKPAAPPLMNFQDLLKLAEKKQFEPIKIEPKKKPEDDDHRPMTKKQKVEFMKEQEWRQRKEEAAKGGQATSYSNQAQRIPKINRKDDSVQNQKSGIADRGQERSSGIGQQMKIPKINNLKREEKFINQPKEEERFTNSVRKDDRPMSGIKRGESIAPSRQNGNLSRDSYSASSKANLSSRDDKILKKVPKVNEDIPKKQRLDSENNVFRKSQIQEERERGKGIRSEPNSSSNALKRLPIKSSEGKQNDDSANIIKNFSGYDKKLQEAIAAKIQEYQNKKRMEECALKPAGKSSGKDLAPKGLKDIERSSTTIKGQGKIPSRTDRPVEQKPHMMNQKSSNISRSSQELNSQNRPSIVPSTKPRVLPPEGKPKQVPSSASRPLSGGDVGMKPTQQTSGQRKLAVTPKPMPPPEVRPKQVPPPGVRQKQVPPENRSKQLPPPADVKPRQFPPPDVKPRQFPSPDVRPRQFPPPDVQRKQFPPQDGRMNSKPPLKRRITDSEDEYDPEMDDFIDDGPEEEEDYSKHIREIFGYDRRKYSRIADDDGDECMESNFATILKEDFISTKTGIMEDLEDIRREKEMERRKKLAKKRNP